MESPSRLELQQLRFNAVMRDDKTLHGMAIGLHGCAINMYQMLTRKHKYTDEDALFAISQELMDVQANIAEFVFSTD